MAEGFIARLARGLGYAVSGDAPSWFGPQAPLPPVAPPEVAGRQFDYPFGFNLAVTPRSGEATGFAELRGLADAHDLLRAVTVGSAKYTTNIIDTGFDDDLRVTSEIETGLGPGQAGAPALAFSIDTWLTGGTDPGVYTPWTIGFLTMRFLKGRIDYAPIVAGAVSFISDFVITIDTSPRIEQGGSFDVAAGGSVLVFPTPFHFPPFMPAPNVLGPTGAGYYASATSVSATQATITIFDHTGVAVAGTVSWSATGE